jgi:hypothetical protein
MGGMDMPIIEIPFFIVDIDWNPKSKRMAHENTIAL